MSSLLAREYGCLYNNWNGKHDQFLRGSAARDALCYENRARTYPLTSRDCRVLSPEKLAEQTRLPTTFSRRKTWWGEAPRLDPRRNPERS